MVVLALGLILAAFVDGLANTFAAITAAFTAPN
jgi:hypothetical protein